MRLHHILPLATVAAMGLSMTAAGHGYAGKRFFPATILVEDPFVADELALPTWTHMKGGEEAGVTSDELEVEFAKRITSTFALSVDGGWSREHGPDGTVDGFSNVGLGAKYQFALDEDAEFVASAGLDVEFGGTGSKRLGVEDFNTYTPTLLIGKGFGSASADWVKPFAVTAFGGVAIPGRGHSGDERNVSHAVYGGTIQYSLPYLHANVKDVGLPDWANQITPVVEFSVDTPLAGDGRTSATINPGFIWAGKSMQIAAEAVIPVNRDSGDSVGFMVQAHFYLDDLFPDSLGKPVLE
jgi:hypothetical protein